MALDPKRTGLMSILVLTSEFLVSYPVNPKMTPLSPDFRSLVYAIEASSSLSPTPVLQACEGTGFAPSFPLDIRD